MLEFNEEQKLKNDNFEFEKQEFYLDYKSDSRKLIFKVFFCHPNHTLLYASSDMLFRFIIKILCENEIRYIENIIKNKNNNLN